MGDKKKKSQSTFQISKIQFSLFMQHQFKSEKKAIQCLVASTGRENTFVNQLQAKLKGCMLTEITVVFSKAPPNPSTLTESLEFY